MQIENQSVRNWLARCADNRKELDNERERYVRLVSLMTDICSKEISDMPHSPNRNNDKYADLIIKKMELEERVKAYVKTTIQEQGMIEWVVQRMDRADYRRIIRLRYIDNESWEYIAQTLYKVDESDDSKQRQTRRWHDAAIEEFTNIVRLDKSHTTALIRDSIKRMY